MDVSVILVSYNTKDLTEQCIKSVYEKTQGIDFEIFVVDNASKDGSASMIKEKFPEVKLIESKENLGFGRANNLAMQESNAKYYFLLNTDTLLVNNAIKILYDFMESNKTCGAAGGNLYNDKMQEIHSFGYGDDLKSLLLRKTPLKLFFLKEYKRIKNYERNSDKTKYQEVNHVTGADLILRADVIKQVGGFSDKIFLYFEETELEHRIKQNGNTIHFVPDSKIIHLEGKSENPYRDRYFINGFITYYKITYGKTWGIIAFLLQISRIIKLNIKIMLKEKRSYKK